MTISQAFWIAVLPGLLFASSGAARFLHLHAVHDGAAHASATSGSRCHHHHAPQPEKPAQPPHSSEDCETCLLIAAAQKSVAAVPSALPLTGDCVVERHDAPHTTVVALSRLDAATQRGPPTRSA